MSVTARGTSVGSWGPADVGRGPTDVGWGPRNISRGPADVGGAPTDISFGLTRGAGGTATPKHPTTPKAAPVERHHK